LIYGSHLSALVYLVTVKLCVFSMSHMLNFTWHIITCFCTECKADFRFETVSSLYGRGIWQWRRV